MIVFAPIIIGILFWYLVHKVVHFKDKDEVDDEDLFN